jgi:hypothetical protein
MSLGDLVVWFANNGTRKLVFARLALLLILAIDGYRCGSRLASQADPAFSFSPAIYEADYWPDPGDAAHACPWPDTVIEAGAYVARLSPRPGLVSAFVKTAADTLRYKRRVATLEKPVSPK